MGAFTRTDVIFGWVPKAKSGDFRVHGAAWPPYFDNLYSVAAFGIEEPTEDLDKSSRSWTTFAHEVGHLLGRRHTNSEACAPEEIDSEQWKFSHSSIYPDFGWSLEEGGSFEGSLRSSTQWDYMSKCADPNSGWTSAFTYTGIFEGLTSTLSAQAEAAAELHFIISGLVFSDDTVVLEPIWILTPTMPLIDGSSGTDYCFEVQDSAGTALSSRCFDLDFENYETSEPSDVAGFNLTMPYHSSAARLVFMKGVQELAVRTVSPTPPTVTLLSPNGGETWNNNETHTITWMGSDSDGDSIIYDVHYSHDGTNWLPLGTNVDVTELVVRVSEIPGGDMARVRVSASDGVNTSTDESDAYFFVEQKAPRAHISVPRNGMTIPPGATFILGGYAYDQEEGMLEDSDLRWGSNRDGLLGTGGLIFTTLSQGDHTITLTASDSIGSSGHSYIDVFVGHRNYLPAILNKPPAADALDSGSAPFTSSMLQLATLVAVGAAVVLRRGRLFRQPI